MDRITYDQMLGLGIRLEPEQSWMWEQSQGHGMALWTPPDPEHEQQCHEGCGYPVLLENDEPLIIPTPIRWNTSHIWVEDDAEEFYGDTWDDWPAIIAQVDTMYSGNMSGWQPYRIWDVFPLTSGEHKQLRDFQQRLFDDMRMHEYTLMAEFEHGEYSIWDHIQDDLDDDVLTKFEDEGDEDGRMYYLETFAEAYMTMLDTQVGFAKQHAWNQEHVNRVLDLLAPGVVDPWRRLRQSSASAWRTAGRCYPPDKRGAFYSSQKWINPWP